jgi:hypothetical protein
MLRKRLPYKCSNLPIHTHFDSYSLEEHILRCEPVDPLPLLQSVICTLLQGVGAGCCPMVPRAFLESRNILLQDVAQAIQT